MLVPRSQSFRARTLPWAAGAAAAVGGWFLQGRGGEPAERDPAEIAIRAVPSQAHGGSAGLIAWGNGLKSTPVRELRDLARGLMAGGRQNDLGYWAPLLARWSMIDGPGMIAFLNEEVPVALRPKLLELGWLALGASDPDAAFAAGRKLLPDLMLRLLEGVADTDPRKAAAFVKEVPRSQVAAGRLAGRIAVAAPDLADEFLADAVYDGGRIRFYAAKIKDLAASDPAAAIDYARSLGGFAFDQVRVAVSEIARLDPEAAAAEVEAMPSSRSKALSAVSLAETWAGQDPEAAVRWVRENLDGPMRHRALIAAAAASGGADPERALDLVVEAGWAEDRDFFQVFEPSMKSTEHASAPDPSGTAALLLRQMAVMDPEGASRYLRDRIPEPLRADLAEKAGIQP